MLSEWIVLIDISNGDWKKKCQKQSINNSEIQKIDIRRDHKLEIEKSLRALVRIDHQIFNMTVDNGSPISFLIWSTAKQFL